MVRQARPEGVTRHEVGSLAPSTDGRNRVVSENTSKLGLSEGLSRYSWYGPPLVRRGAGGNGRRTAVAVVAVIAAGLLPTLGSASQRATPHARAAALRAQRAAVARREHRAVLVLYAVESDLAKARGDLATLRARAAVVAREREVVRRRAAAVRRSLEVARERLARELRSLYEQGQPDPVAILLGATSIDQATAGIDNLRRVARANRRLIAELKRKRSTLAVLEARLRARDRALAAARRTARAAAARFDGVARDRLRTLAALHVQRDLTRRQLATLDALARRAERRSTALTRARVATPVSKVTPAQAAQTSPAPNGRRTRTLLVDAVAYHLPGRTASGLPVGVGVVAVDPTVIPLGTRLFVPGYGRAVAADVGSAVKGNIIDLWMPTRAKARAWGRRTVTITIYG